MNLTALENVSVLSSRVIRILAQNPGVGPLQGTNTYLIGTGANRILIDSGDHPNVNPAANIEKYHQLLNEKLTSVNCKIDTLLLTHWHSDHTGGVEGIIKSSLGLVSHNVNIRKFRCGKAEDERLPFHNSYTSHLVDREVIETEGATLRVLYTPGHATDHASFYLEEDGILFTGDCILGETSALVENLTDYMKTLNIYKTLDKPVKKIFPGHGPVVENGAAKVEEYIQHRMKRENQILECLKKEPMSTDELLASVYAGLNDKLKPLALKNIDVHLEKLIDENIVEVLSRTEQPLKYKIADCRL
ncbi:endoribonuclease LACTB2-like [Convolutriloba macropyga]|uniref:endoribonuclease LACTB2-like n=1 Tax=Convolutriloba macropyga TaxID=536237 RepID=UPI003F527B22